MNLEAFLRNIKITVLKPCKKKMLYDHDSPPYLFPPTKGFVRQREGNFLLTLILCFNVGSSNNIGRHAI